MRLFSLHPPSSLGGGLYSLRIYALDHLGAVPRREGAWEVMSIDCAMALLPWGVRLADEGMASKAGSAWVWLQP